MGIGEIKAVFLDRDGVLNEFFLRDGTPRPPAGLDELAIYPDAADAARAILKRIAGGHHMPLMEFYLYPAKYISSAAIATLVPPSARPAAEAEAYRTEKADVVTVLPELVEPI